MFSWDTSFYSVSQILNKFPDLSLFTSLVFSNDHWNLPALFVDNCQMLLNKEIPLLEAGKYSLVSNKIQSNIQVVLTLIIYPFSLVVSTKCTNSSIFTGKNTFCTAFKNMWLKPVRLKSINGSGFLSQVKSNFFK